MSGNLTIQCTTRVIAGDVIVPRTRHTTRLMSWNYWLTGGQEETN